MNCPEARALLTADYLDGELDPAAAAPLEEHLEGCPECRGRLQTARRLKELVREAEGTEAAPLEVRQRLLERLEAERQRALPWRLPQPLRAGLAAAVVALLALGGFLALRSPEPPAAVVAFTGHHVSCWKISPAAVSGDRTVEGWLLAQGLRMPEMPRLPAGTVRYDLRHCRVVDDHQGLHALYRLPRQQHLSLYAIPVAQLEGFEPPPTPQMFTSGGITVAVWRRGGWVFAMVSEMPREQLRRLALEGSGARG